MNTRITVALIFAGVWAASPPAPPAETFKKMARSPIQARLAGMELTDEVHWDDLYQPNGVLVTNEMGHKTTGKWRVQKDQLCLDRGRQLGSGGYDVWLAGKNVQLKNNESSLPL